MRKKYNVLKKIIHFIKPSFFSFSCSLLAAACSVALTLYAPILTGEAIDYAVGQGAVQFSKILYILKILAVVVLITALAQWLMNYCNYTITYRVVKEIRIRAFDQLTKLTVSYVDQTPKGEIISRIISDVEQFCEGLLMGFTQFFTGILTIIGTLYFMLRMNGMISMVVIVITPLSFFVAGFIAKRTYRMFQAQSEIRAELTSFINEMAGNQKLIRAFGYEACAMERFETLNQKLEQASLRATFFSSITNPSTRFVNGLVYTGVGITGAFAAMAGRISVGQLSCFLSYANQYTKPFNEISSVIAELQNSIACAERVFQFIEETPTVEKEEGELEVSQMDGKVEFKNVSFSYDKEKKLLQNINLKVKKGEKVAIVGPTGCGKTTLINLLLRFYEVDQGTILFDDLDIRSINRECLRKNYGMVLQDTWLKAGTIAENIAYGKEHATRQEIIEAAKAAHAHSFITRMEQGYDTILAEDGGNLSQGEKQLLCIARVMLKLPPILILDEATSSIDTRTEVKIQKAFQKMMKGRTTFIVAHRLSTIREADLILVMKDGNIVEQGTHEELLSRNGFYKELYESQFAN